MLVQWMPETFHAQSNMTEIMMLCTVLTTVFIRIFIFQVKKRNTKVGDKRCDEKDTQNLF